jgi:hypothetical protein
VVGNITTCCLCPAGDILSAVLLMVRILATFIFVGLDPILPYSI